MGKAVRFRGVSLARVRSPAAEVTAPNVALLAVLLTALLLPAPPARSQNARGAPGGGAAASPGLVEAAPPEIPPCCLIAGRPVRDFRLRDVVSGKNVTFLDAARRDYTFLFYADTRSYPCLDSINFLTGIRDRHRGRVGLVAVFLEPGDEGEILGYLMDHGLFPDYALQDPDGRLGRACGIERVPALQVIGPDGGVVFRGDCARPTNVSAFASRLEHVLEMTRQGRGRFCEARRIYADSQGWLDEGNRAMAVLYLQRVLELQPNLHTVNRALADLYRDMHMPREAARHYGRYIAADALAYDLQEIRESVRSLSAR